MSLAYFFLCVGIFVGCNFHVQGTTQEGNVEKRNEWPFNIEYVRVPKDIQSPINIVTNVIERREMPPLITDFHRMSENDTMQCKNDGNTFTCTVISGRVPTVQGGPLQRKFIFDDLHFHWAAGQSNGSEHKINGYRFASEFHAVFRNERYDNMSQAVMYQDGICVMSWLGIHRETATEGLKNVFKVVEGLVEYGKSVEEKWPHLFDFVNALLEPHEDNAANWLTYPGALTVPPYWESATWILFDRVFAISDKERVAQVIEAMTSSSQQAVRATKPPVGRHIHVKNYFTTLPLSINAWFEF